LSIRCAEGLCLFRKWIPPRLELPPLEFFNGLGGFSDDGREYVIVLDNGQWTPAPWINVIANAGFGFYGSRIGKRLHLVW